MWAIRPSSERLLEKCAFLRLGFGFFWRDYYGGGYFVVAVEVEEFDSAGGAAGGADGFGVDADDLAELADDHELAGLVDEASAESLPALGVAFTLMTPLPPRDWRRYWSTPVRSP
jgi:hypothetical protein